MARAKKVCSVPHCPELQPCPEHEKEPWAGSTRRSELPSNWESIRRRILDRDPACKVCDNALSTEVDHIHDPHDHSDENLQGICSRCHTDKTQREAALARRNRHGRSSEAAP